MDFYSTQLVFTPPGEPRGELLDFWNGVLMSNNFLRPQIIRLTFSKTPNNQLPSFEKNLILKNGLDTDILEISDPK